MAGLDPLQPVHAPQWLRKHRLVEEDEGVQCLRLGRSSHFAADRQMIEEGLYLNGPKLSRVAFAVKEDVLPNPVAIALFGTGAEMTATADGCEQVEQAGRMITPLR